MSRSVLSLRLPAHLQAKLVHHGYHTVADFDESPLTNDLSQLLTQPELRCLALTAQAQPSAHSAWLLRQQAQAQSYFSTQLSQLDALLGGRGVPLGCITEVFGEPGSGQTELCLRLCLAARLPANLGGLGANSVYIDTVGSFSYCGAARAARSLCLQRPDHSDGIEGIATQATASLLDGIHVFRVYAAHELMALLCSFEQIARQTAGIGLVVLNTVSWPCFVSFASNIARRQAMHAELARILAQIAAKHSVAVVLVSQAKSAAPSRDSSRALLPVPADGDVWARLTANRIALQRQPGSDSFTATLCASTMYPTAETTVEM
ncbi:DNA repair protein rad51c [Coemansia thaxteri]|nr:DNA repair protein rad51c [Coemansia thaxteri]KAJ2471362.1 DNA repair protein rad51c [Coemansia sp. RSA 2322]